MGIPWAAVLGLTVWSGTWLGLAEAPASQPTGEVKISVVDEGGKPAAGVEIFWRWDVPSPTTTTSAPAELETDGSRTSGADGGVSIPRVPGANALVLGFVPTPGGFFGRLMVDDPAQLKSNEFRLVARRPVLVAGTVVDEQGNAIAKADLVLADATKGLVRSLATTDGAGRFRFIGVEERGQYFVGVMSADGRTAREPINVTGDTSDLNVVCRWHERKIESVLFECYTVDEKGQEAKLPEDGGPRQIRVYGPGGFGARVVDSAFTAYMLPPGSYSFAVDPPIDWVPKPPATATLKLGDTRCRIAFVRRPSLHVLVKDAQSGKVLPGMVVQLNDMGPRLPLDVQVTDANGLATFPRGCFNGQLTVAPLGRDQSYVPKVQDFTVTEDGAQVVVVLEPAVRGVPRTQPGAVGTTRSFNADR